MSARDRLHNTVRNALIKDGWDITHDPLTLSWGERKLFVDLAAEQNNIEQKIAVEIAVEVKGFSRKSDMADLENALGQCLLYHDVLAELDPDRTLYLGIPEGALYVFEEPLGALMLRNKRVRLLVFSAEKEEILQWIP